MFKVLLRKNFLEVGSLFFADRKKGGKLHGGKRIGIAILYVVCFIALAFAFVGLSVALFTAVPEGDEWIAWSLMGAMSVVLSTIINSLTSFTQLYLARDNEFLISMPIKPGIIIFSRAISVYLMGLVYIAIAWIPAIIVATFMHKISGLLIINNVIIMLIMGFMTLAFTCFFSWIIAAISTKLKSKKILLSLISLIFIGGLYYLQFRANYLINSLTKHIDKAADIMKSGLYPFYQQGLASNGSLGGLLIFTLITAALLALAYLLLSKTFVKIATTKKSGKKAKFSQKQIRFSTGKRALYNRERRRFFGSFAYLLNVGISSMIMIIASLFLFIKQDFFVERINPIFKAVPDFRMVLPIMIIAVVFFIESMSTTSSSSISMEGKQLWLIQTLPVNPYDLFKAKISFSTTIQGLPAFVLTMALSDAFEISGLERILLVLVSIVFSEFSSTFGLVMNLKYPRLDWTSETTAVKQGTSVAFTLFGGWVIAIVIGGIMFLLRNLIDIKIMLGGVNVLLIVVYLVLDRWLRTKGVELFKNLA